MACEDRFFCRASDLLAFVLGKQDACPTARGTSSPVKRPPQGLSTDLAAWVELFRLRTGRAPRILHIGNIANNGYNNAKLLNRAGFDCDTLCYDYYHIMSCPEWEDADYTGDIRSDNYPSWQCVDLRGFERPRWFAQGPAQLCMKYLIARREGKAPEADKLWNELVSQRETTCARLRGDIPPPTRMERFLVLSGKAIRKFWKLPYILAQRTPIGRKLYWALAGRTFRKRVRELCEQFSVLFPDRPDKLRPIELQDFGFQHALWVELIGHYDVVVGYATDGIYPLLAGNVPYVAFEHGTIRNIPFQPTLQGRLCALTYCQSDVAFITNCDNNIAAEKLKIPNYKWVPHPINEDEHPTTRPDQVRAELRERLKSDFVLFHPSRHHWSPSRNTDWDKGNDILIEGFARFVREVNPRAGAVFVEWGLTLAESKALIAKNGIEKNILWIQPQPTPRMNAYIQAADVLADQFCIGTFGGIMPKGLLFGTPNLIYLDEAVHKWCLPEFPPILNTRTPDDVFAALKRLYEEPGYAKQISDSGIEWYAKHHSSQVVADAFAEAVRDTTSGGPTEIPK